MNYLTAMKRVLTMDSRIYRDLFEQNLSLRFSVINVLLIGIVYGGSSIYFSRYLNSMSEGISLTGKNMVLILMIGSSIAFLVHGGAALFIWVFCRGIGGVPQFSVTYINLGIGSIALLPLMPGISLMQTTDSGLPLVAYVVVMSALAGLILYQSVKSVVGLSALKTKLALGAAVTYIGCFLYLWM